MKPRSIAARLEHLEAAHVGRRVPRTWITPTDDAEVYEVRAGGQTFHRLPGESWPDLKGRAEAATTCPLLVAVSKEWETL
ncbi:MAG: hypothetical protein ACEB74_01970 [Desulfovibrio aminophilus]|uniref:hypothetical protein n=1 Tax=Desulfovibrio aminophilus TaxID=81425 RepID=UPI0039E79965